MAAPPSLFPAGVRGFFRLAGYVGFGFIALSTAASTAVRFAAAVNDKRRAKTAPKCTACKGEKSWPCQLCSSRGTVKWSPLADPVLQRACLCPTCDGRKVQKCLNCLGKGYI